MEGNQMKMREALVEARQIVAYAAHRRFGFMRAHNGSTKVIIASETLEKVDAALSAPARNCDVGTPEEQSKRYDEFCDIHDCRSDCPLFKADSCELAWAQMPYEAQKGGAE